MNANETLDKKRKNARAIVKYGVALMSISVVLFLITLFCFNATVHPGSSGELAGLGIAFPLLIEALIFMPGFLLLLIGLLVGLIDRLENRRVIDHGASPQHRGSCWNSRGGSHSEECCQAK